MIIDISNNQGRIKWNQIPMNDPKIEGIYLKVSEGVGYVDSSLRVNALEAAMLQIDIGYYHFATLNNTIDIEGDAKTEANFFIKSMSGLPSPRLPYILDIETNKSHLTKEQVLLWIKTFFKELEKKDLRNYAIYSYTSFLNENLPDNHGLGNIKLWLASYTPTYKLPKGWDKLYLWQYSNQGKINGIDVHVDLNKKPSL